MDKRVIFAVAGSGKTSNIINQIEVDSRCLIITYTENNTNNINNRIINKFGKVPEGVRVYSYFRFLYSFCFKPLLGHKLKTKGINFDYPLPQHHLYAPKKEVRHYIDKNGRLFANRISKLLIEFKIIPELIERLEKFFDFMYIDEVQDFAANDFNLLCEFPKAQINLLLVGDFYQHTFDTSRDGNIQKSLHDCFFKYQKKLHEAGYLIDLKTLSNSYRCSPTVCSFVQENLGIQIQSHRKDQVQLKFIENEPDIHSIYNNNSIVKLFYQKSRSYRGNKANWGDTKGLDSFHDVCVVLNSKTLKAFEQNKLDQLPQTTKNKLYVACTRAKGDLYFVPEEKLKIYKK